MVEVTCAVSGIIFEAKTKRTKQHPLIADAKAKASKNNKYRQLNEAFEVVRSAGGYETVKEFMALVNDHMAEVSQARDAAILSRRKASEAAAAEAKANREEQNRILNANGYKWSKITIGTEEEQFPGGYYAGIGEFSHYEWRLISPDGKYVTVAEAMATINGEVTEVEAATPAPAVSAEEPHTPYNIPTSNDGKEMPDGYVATTVYNLNGAKGDVIDVDGVTVYKTYTGVQPWIHAPLELAQQWWQEHFNADPAKRAWEILEYHLSDDGDSPVYGKEYRDYIIESMGLEALAEVARQHVPVVKPRWVAPAEASKVFRLPILNEDTGELGYGSPGETVERITDRLSATRAHHIEAIVQRSAWVPLGREDELPTLADARKWQR